MDLCCSSPLPPRVRGFPIRSGGAGWETGTAVLCAQVARSFVPWAFLSPSCSLVTAFSLFLFPFFLSWSGARRQESGTSLTSF